LGFSGMAAAAAVSCGSEEARPTDDIPALRLPAAARCLERRSI
jgi:hypothetical protein